MIYIVSSSPSFKYGFWRVIFPAGSPCKVTNGTKTINAPDSAVAIGRYCFPIPESGTWTVSCTDGTRTASKTQTISTQYSYFATTLRYDLILYDAGNRFAEVTGGWSYTGNNSPVFNANNIVVEPTVSNGTCVLTTVNKIDLTGIKTLHFYLKCDTTGSLSTGGNCQAVGAHTSNTIRVDNNRMTADVKVPSTADYKDYTVDVSALSGSYYILVATLSVERLWYAKLTVRKIWGEYA